MIKSLVVLLLSVFAITTTAPLWAQGGVPAQANPAQLINQMQRDRWFQNNYNMWGPISEEDYMPKNDAVIEFHDMEVEAKILKQQKETGEPQSAQGPGVQ